MESNHQAINLGWFSRPITYHYVLLSIGGDTENRTRRKGLKARYVIHLHHIPMIYI